MKVQVRSLQSQYPEVNPNSIKATAFTGLKRNSERPVLLGQPVLLEPPGQRALQAQPVLPAL